ncbi:MAG: hypothetical protein MIN69_16115 [Methylorubrum extorquens]
MTNAFKYAYPDCDGDVRISVRAIESGHLQVTICDQGLGLPPDLDAGRSKSLGMKLIATLGRQLGGQPDWQDANPGTRFVLNFLPHHGPAPSG